MDKKELIERMLAKTSYTPESALYQRMMKQLLRMSHTTIYILASQVAGVTTYRES